MKHIRDVVIGIDPGPVVGICVLSHLTPRLIQADAFSALEFIDTYVNAVRKAAMAEAGYIVGLQWRLVIATETFVEGHRSGRVATRGASQAARDMNGALANRFRNADGPVMGLRTRSASIVKTWAVDLRLRQYGVLDLDAATSKMPHALDAARHAAYAATADLGWPDPLAHKV